MLGVALVIIAISVMLGVFIGIARRKEEFHASKCFSCDDQVGGVIRHPERCFDCWNGSSSSLDYQLGFTKGPAKMGRL